MDIYPLKVVVLADESGIYQVDDLARSGNLFVRMPYLLGKSGSSTATTDALGVDLDKGM